MLPKLNRIKKKKDFETIFKNSKSFKTNLFIFRITENSLGLNRFGFVISHKISKKAVTRNKIRRRLTEIIKSETKNIKTGTDLVIITLPNIKNKDFPEIKEAIRNVLVKAKLIVTD